MRPTRASVLKRSPSGTRIGRRLGSASWNAAPQCPQTGGVDTTNRAAETGLVQRGFRSGSAPAPTKTG